jgi:hypothetical protein
VQNRQNLDRGLISQKSRTSLQDFRLIRIMNYFPTVNPVHRVHARWTGAGRVVHHGPTVAWTEGTVVRSPELRLRPLRCTEAHRRGRNRERETWGTRLGPHRGSGGAKEAGRWQCRTGRRRRSVRGLLRWGEREIGAGRGAVKLREGARLL